ncbi:DUF2871 family protein [Tessaracoccus flavus]|jgi:hypothetical protein|uniref:Uncharacterized protein n=1 Tax=Tessaracoccus flavus TaxID=1610493 RepID=A0A1Q2CFZ9_9ACTN|nr:DUF2871 family protein [Tessaracoccus flavus]AQP45034.1 hypothetical protein RPIT_09750 [Tessaracoccus flavus]SDY58524.1 Protein of unknown function [Tessaracoccus flavus]
MLDRLFNAAALWTALGLLSGFYWREITKFSGFEDRSETMLATAHTHALSLGTLVLLAVLALAKTFGIAEKSGRLFVTLWHVGLGLTFGAMVVKGTLQVLGVPLAESAMWAGIGGLGHMVITGTLVYFFVILRRALKTTDATATLPATVEP